ncbi:MAG: hemerythrin family protein [Thiomargarita sp.]|nr:hemerythrin family protein [Thiomargarita sp.]
MAFITWSNEYSVNIKEIDRQHQFLINIINKMHELVMTDAGDAANRSDIRRVFAKLADYTDYHFRTEEELFKTHNYPGFKIHKQQHNELVLQILELQRRFLKNEVSITQEIFNFLKKWLLNHILISDKEYTVFLNAKGVF